MTGESSGMMSSDEQSDGGPARSLPEESEKPIRDEVSSIENPLDHVKPRLLGLTSCEGKKREVNKEEELELQRELGLAGVRTTVAKWVAHPLFESAVIVLILLNCVQLAMYNPLQPEDKGLNLILDGSDKVFTVAFTIELVFKMIGLGPVRYFQDGFNWLDFLCVAIGWLSIVPGGGDTGGLSAIRSLRVLRPLRTMSSFPGMRVIVQTILASLPMCGVVLLLAMYLFSIFAIFGVQSFAGVLKHRCVTTASIAVYETSGNLRDLDFDNDEMCTTYRNEKIWKGHFCDEGFECMKVVNPNYGVTNFDSLLPALLLIFQVVTLEGWTPIMYWTSDCTTGWVVVYFLLIVFSGSFYVLNLGLAVVSSGLEDSQQHEEDAHAAEDVAAGASIPMSPARRRMQELEEARAKEEKARELTGVRKYMHDVVQSDRFTNFVTACILFNTVVLAINYYGASKTYVEVLEVLNTVCTFVFLVEMAMKMIGLGWEYWHDSFNVFDTIVNLTSLAMFLLQVSTSSESISSLSALRAVRILRVLKLMKRAESLQNFIVVLFATVSELGNFCALVALVIMIFALLGMQFFGGQFFLTDNWPEEDIYPRANFDSFGWAVITVFQILTGEDWNSVMYYGIKATGYGATIYFISLLMVGDFIVMNLFIAILLSSFEKHRMIREETKQLEMAKEAASSQEGKNNANKPEAQESGAINSDEHEFTTPPGSLAEDLHILTPDEEHVLAEKQLKQVIAAEHSWKPLEMYELKSMWLFASHHPVRKSAYALCTNAWTERIVLTLIILSGLIMTLESPGIDKNPVWKEFFFVTNHFFTAIFTAELIAKVMAFGMYGESGSYLSDSWNILDALVVLVSYTLLLVNDIPGLSSIHVMRVLRVGRPLRMIQRFPELRLVVQALVGSMKALGNVIVIASLFWSIFAILGMAFFMGKYNYCTDPDESITKATCVGDWVPDPKFPTVTEVREWRTYDNNFDNFYNAVTTLFEMSTTEGWVDVMLNGVDAVAEDKNPKRNYNEPMALFFIVFMVFAYFLIVNLFVGIIMENFSEKRDELKGKVFMTPRQQEWVTTMKASWKEKIEKTPEFESQWRARLYDFVVSPPFQFFIAACIAMNVCVLASFHEGQTQGWTTFQNVSDDIFLLIFAIECVLKIIAFNPIRYLSNGWNLFDFSVVILLSVTFFTGIDFNTSVLRILRITRLLRLVRGMKAFVKMFDMLITSAPTLLNVGGLLFIVFFVYAVAGMQLFGHVNRHQEFLNESSNFKNFGNSLMILMRMVTGESWNGVMYDCMVQPPFCDNDNNPNHDNGCGSKLEAYVYFLSFTLLGSWIMLNLFLAVVLENYESSGDDSKVIDEYDIENFKTVWMKIDKKGEGVIRVTSLRALLMQLRPPMGSCGSTEASILNIEVPLSGKHSELVTFYDVLNAIINHVYRNNSEKLPDLVESTLSQAQDKFLEKMREDTDDVEKEEDKDRKVDATSVTLSATVTIQTAVREYISRRDVQTSLPLLKKATEEVMQSGLVVMSHEHLFWDALEGKQPTAQEDTWPMSPYQAARTNNPFKQRSLTIPSNDLSFLDVYLTPKAYHTPRTS